MASHNRGQSAAHLRKPSNVKLSIMSELDDSISTAHAYVSPVSPSSSRSSALSSGNGSRKPASAAEVKFEQTRLRNSRQRRLLFVLGLLTVIAVLWYGNRVWRIRSVRRQSQERKGRMAGRGEAFHVPTKYKEAEAESMCKRVMVLRFGTTESFASSILLYLRTAVIATKLGYTFLPDDSAWQYRSISDYFIPPSIFCVPPTDWFLASTPLGSSRWRNSDRVIVTHANSDAVDIWIRDEILDIEALESAKEEMTKVYEGVLPEGETVHEALEDSFGDYLGAARTFWRPNDFLATMIRAQRMELGLGSGGVRNRKHSPSFGGRRRRNDDPARASVEEVDQAGEDHDFDESGGAERSDRGPLIVVQAKLGASTMEAKIAEGVEEAVGRLSRSSTIAQPGFSRSRPTLFPPEAKSTLLFITPDASRLDPLVIPSLANYTLATPSLPSSTSLQQWEPYSEQIKSLQAKFVQSEFNMLDMSLRVHLTRFYIRDLTLAALYSDALLVSGSTGSGQLAILLAGEDAVIGPRGISGSGLGGRVRSIDEPWTPVNRRSALWS